MIDTLVAVLVLRFPGLDSRFRALNFSALSISRGTGRVRRLDVRWHQAFVRIVGPRFDTAAIGVIVAQQQGNDYHGYGPGLLRRRTLLLWRRTFRLSFRIASQFRR